MAKIQERLSRRYNRNFLHKIVLLFLLILVAVSVFNCSDDSKNTNGDEGGDEGSANQDNYGDPYNVTINQVDSERIAFGLITDTHIDVGNCDYHNPNQRRAIQVANDINIDCSKAGCLGVVHLGDYTNGNNTQYIVAFRQIFENDYPGHSGGAIAGAKDNDYDCYSDGTKINFPVFPTVGNHDIGPFKDSENWEKALDYIEDRIGGAKHLLEHYNKVNYVWQWGKYVFFQLGQWAGSCTNEIDNQIDYDKISWLRSALKKHVGNSGLGVFILQHYGFEGFSREARWWNDTQRKIELAVLCRRPYNYSLSGSDPPPGVPYNTIAFLTGHNHKPELIDVPADGKDLNGSDITFKDYVNISSGGKYPNTGSPGFYGFSIAQLDGSQMIINTKTCTDDDPDNDNEKECLDNSWSTQTLNYSIGVMDEPDSFRFTVGRNMQSDGSISSWDSMTNRPFSGDTELGGGVAHAYIGGDDRYNKTDIIMVGIDSQPGPKRFYYRIGFDYLELQGGGFNSWGSIKYSPQIGSLAAGAGAAAADINGKGGTDLVLMYVDAPKGANQFRYMVGWDLDAEGNPESWSEIIHGPSPGDLSAGGGAAIADINGNGSLDLLLMDIDAPDGPDNFRYTIAWDLDTEGNPASWSEIIHGPSPGDLSAGGGAAIADIDGNGVHDLLLMSMDSPDGPNHYRWVIGWNLNKSGVPESWSDVRQGSSPGTLSIGAGATIFDTELGSQQALFLMDIDDPLGERITGGCQSLNSQ
jgi:hypothetical protein